VPAAWEPDGADFFSPSLMEADLMRRVLPAEEFRAWFGRFLPDADKGEPKALLEPAKVTDRSDPQLVHLDGLNLMPGVVYAKRGGGAGEGRPGAEGAGRVGGATREAALRHVASGDYAGEHWLASFAV